MSRQVIRILGGCFLLLSITVVSSVVFAVGPNSESNSGQVGVFYPGVVTGITEKVIQINSTDYGVDMNLVIRDEDGRVRAWKDLRKGLMVKIHLKKGKIDHIIRILRR